MPDAPSRGPRAENGAGSVRPHRGQWRVKVTVALIQGQQRQVSRVVPTRREAEVVRAQLIADHSRGALTLPSVLRVQALLDRWLVDKARTVRLSTLEGYRFVVARYITPHLGHHLVQKVRPSDVRRCYAALAEQYSVSVLRQVRTVLLQAFADAVLDDVVARNPALGLRLPRSAKTPTEGRALTPDEVQALLGAADARQFGPLIEILIWTGLRRGEVCALKWSHLDLDRCLLRVQETVTMVGGQPQLGPPKTRSSLRTVPLAAQTVTLLRRWQLAQRLQGEALGEGWQDSGHVFSTLHGSRVHPDVLSRWVSRLGREAQLGRVRCHDLRHTYASLLMSRGVPAEVVQAWLGHSSVNVTLNVYRHLLPHEHTEHAAILDQLLDGAPRNLAFAPDVRDQSTPNTLDRASQSSIVTG